MHTALTWHFAPLGAMASLGTVHFVEKLAIEQGAPAGPFAFGQTAVAMLVLAPIWLWRRRGLVLMTSRGLGAAPNTGDWILIATVPLVGFSDAFAKKVLGHVSPLTVSFWRYLFGTVHPSARGIRQKRKMP